VAAAGLVLVSVIVLSAAIGGAQQNPAEEARLKKLDAGPKTIDVSKYPPEQQQAYKLFQTKCSSCHAVARGISTEMVLPGDWERYIKRMMFKPNSGITNDEGRTLYRFMVYDGSVRKLESLGMALAALPPPDRAAAVEKVKTVNPAFSAP
jgi:hypothetical protein